MAETINRQTIQWFPGHMTKAERMMEESIRSVDLLCEIRDARIPYSSMNPDIDRICGDKPRVIILSREDLADPIATQKWISFLKEKGILCFSADVRDKSAGKKFSQLVRSVLKDKIESNALKGMSGKPIRVMVAGIPNVGKSTVINSIAGRKAAIAADKPGVTRGKQWIHVETGLELLDTPGILWPKFDNKAVGEKLAITGAVKTEVIDTVELAAFFIKNLCTNYPQSVKDRYKIEFSNEDTGYELLERTALKRGMLISRGEADIERMALVLLKEYRDGKLGRITLEMPGEENV